MPAPSTLIGRILGGYVIQSQIGAGGMGVVYRAHDDRLGRTVAIKVLPPKFNSDETMRQRFLREGRTAARIDHPNVVRILSAGEEPGLPFLVMEFVDGGSLQRLLEKRIRLPIATTIRIIRQIAEALHAAHKVGVMHRDVKPANVLFTKEGEPKLVDFGLAREEMSEVNLSQTGMVMGTPHYMAPEVCEGKKADARADIYALAVVMYAMIAGRLPFDGETAIAILMAHIQKPVPAIPEAPRAVASVLAHALEKDPSKRYQTGAAFAEALNKAAEAVGKQGEVLAQAAGFAPVVVAAPVAQPKARPSPPPVLQPVTTSSPGGLLPTAVTPSAGVSAVRPRVPLAAWTAGGIAVALLALLGIVFGFRNSHAPAKPAPTVATERPAAVDPAGEIPALPEAGDEEWDRESKAAAGLARTLEGSDDFSKALTVWNELSTPNTRAAGIVAREKSALLSRASLRAQKEIDQAPRGAAGARNCRDLAARMPPEAAAPLLAAALANERDWQPRDGLGAFRGVLAARDLQVAAALLGSIEEPPEGPERQTLEEAKLAVSRLKLVFEKAGEWYRTHAGTAVEMRRADGVVVAGTLHGVDEKARQILLRTRDELVALGVNDIAASEFSLRALDGCPSDDLVAAAVDVSLFCGGPREAWPAAIRARQRGLRLGADRDRLLMAEVSPADRADAESLRKSMETMEDDAPKQAELAREWLRRFGAAPFDPRVAASARKIIRAAGGPASTADLSLCLAARVTETAEGVCFRWNDVDSLLADFAPIGRASAAPGDVPALKAASEGTCLVLQGLRWSDFTIEAEFRPENAMALMTGWRSPFEHLSTVIVPADHGGRALTFPVAGSTYPIGPSTGTWDRILLTVKGSHLEIRIGSENRNCDLPVAWAGEIGIWFKAGLAFRFVEVRGHPEFAEASGEEEFKALEKSGKRTKGSGKNSWRTWTEPAGKSDKITVVAGEEFEWLRTKTWDAGDDYRMSFVLHPWGQSDLAIDLRTDGKSRRRVVLGADPHNGFFVGGHFMAAGAGLSIPHEQDIRVVILVKGDLAQIEVDGKMAWRGHLEGLQHGGVEVGVRRGSIQLDKLQIQEIEK